MHFHIVTSLTKYFILVFHQRKKKIPFILKYIFTQTIKERKRYSPFEIYKWFLAMEYCIGEVMMWEGIYLYVSSIKISTRSVISWNIWEWGKCHFMKYLGEVCIIYICMYEKKKKKRGWCKLHLFIFFSQFNKPIQMANFFSLELGSGWYCTQCNYPHSPKKKKKTTLTF